MTKKQIKQLVQKSYIKGVLDQNLALQIANKLKRGGLKKYIKELKNKEKAKTVVVEVPLEAKDKIYQNLKNVFPEKQVVFRKNADIISGVRIINNDLIYDLNIKNNFDKILEYIEKSYDGCR